MLDQMDFMQSPRLQALRDQAESSKNEEDKRKFLTMLVKEIINALGDVTVSNLKDGVNVNNLDEIKASLRNELTRASKPITDILKKLNLSTQEQTGVLSDIERLAVQEVSSDYQTIIVKRTTNKVDVQNFDDIQFPKNISVDNLSSLEKKLEELIKKVSALKLAVSLPAPQVTVNPTPVNIPETVLNVPPLDLEPIISSLDKNLKLVRTNNKSNPLAVRLTDGGDWIKELKAISDKQGQTVQYMSDVNYIKDNSGQRINPATSEGQSFMLVPRMYDYILLNPPSQPTTIIYKQGGSSGVTVATLTITYNGSDIESITRS